MARGLATVRDQVASWALQQLFQGLEENWPLWKLSSYIHWITAADPVMFRTALCEFIARKGWDASKPVLFKLCRTPLRGWIPADVMPGFVILDLEWSPDVGIREIALVCSWGLVDTGEVTTRVAPVGQGLPASVIRELLVPALRQQGLVILTGHNIRKFDLERLIETGIRLPDVPVLDTLELSLITRPLVSRHALGGNHTALDDVKANLRLLHELDGIWLRVDQDELLWHLHWNAENPGLRRYLEWVATRRGIRWDQPRPPLSELLARSAGCRPEAKETKWGEQTGFSPVDSSPSGVDERPAKGDGRFDEASADRKTDIGKRGARTGVSVLPSFTHHRFGDPSPGVALLEELFEAVSTASTATSAPPFALSSSPSTTETALSLYELSRIVMPEDVPGFVKLARERGFIVATPAHVIDGYRALARRHGLLKTEGTVGALDERVMDERLLSALKGELRGVVASYLFRWFKAGGRYLHEVHPWILLEGTNDLSVKALFTTLDARPPEARVVDHVAGLRFVEEKLPVIFLECEYFDEAAPYALGETASVELADAKLAALVHRFIDDRVLKEIPVYDRPVAHLFSRADFEDTVLRALVEELRAKGDARAEKVAQLLADPPRESESVALTLHDLDNDRLVLTVTRFPCNLEGLRARIMNLSRQSVFACGPGGEHALSAEVSNLFPGGVTSSPQRGMPEISIGVLQDGTMGSAWGVSRALVALARNILRAWTAAAPDNPADLPERASFRVPSVLGLSPEVQTVFAKALRKGGIRAFESTLFGSRPRTVERIDGLALGVFITDSRPLPVPSFVKHVVLTRLPFPGRTDPFVLAQLSSRASVGDVFLEVILPRMLRRLRRDAALLWSHGISLSLLDRRALRYTEIRRGISRFAGKLTPLAALQAESGLSVTSAAETASVITAPSAGLGTARESHLDEPAGMDKVLEALKAELTSIGIREGKGAYQDVDPLPVLRRLHGPSAEWRGEQERVVRRILAGEDVLAVMPTGSGKSTCYQVPALIFGELGEHLTIVISPLISLMRDQVSSLQRRGIFGVSAFHGELSPEERARILRDIRYGWTTLLYVAPEQLLNEVLVDILIERGVRFLVVDEAHCISEWGHNFRPEYRRIPEFLHELARERGDERAQVAAFTATATPSVRRDICELLEIKTPPIVAGIRRENLSPKILPLPAQVPASRRIDEIVRFMEKRRGEPGIIYVTTRSGTEKVAQQLKERGVPGFPEEAIDFLHAGVADRSRREESFLKPGGSTKVLVATTAFGMGVDKPDIGWIVHADAPGSVEAYLQEIGRAARDPRIRGAALSMASPEDLALRERMNRLLDNRDVFDVLEWIRSQNWVDGYGYVSLETLSAETRLEEETAKSALFALERAGILKVLGRGWTANHVEVAPTFSSDTGLTREETLVVQAVRRFPGLSLSERVKALKETGLPLIEIDQIVSGLLARGILVREAGVRVYPVGQRRWRRSVLERYVRQGIELARFIQDRFEQGTGRVIRLDVKAQLRAAEVASARLDELDRHLAEFRSRGWIQVAGGIFRVDIRVVDEEFVHHAMVNYAAVQRLMDDLEEGWAQGIPWKGEAKSRELRRNLGTLAAVGVIRWEDFTVSANGYQVRLVSPPEEDRRRVARLALHERRKAFHLRHRALEVLFSKERDAADVWDFLESYFDSDYPLDTAENLKERIVEGLTPQQRGAVEAPIDKPLLINAGAGTGKTHVLARRVMMLQLCGIDADEILVLTFSRAGATAIGDRIRKLASELGMRPVRAMTFHSFCYHLLQLLGRSITVVRGVPVPSSLRTRKAYLDRTPLNEVLVDLYPRLLSRAPAAAPERDNPPQKIKDYNEVLDALRSGHPDLSRVITTPDELDGNDIPEVLRLRDDSGELPTPWVKRVFAAYLDELATRGLLDYAQMVSEVLERLRSDHALRKRMQNRLSHLLVDEYQDTSRAQEEVMRLLLGPHTGLTVVGDSDQTIYSFNGSDIRNILDFAKRNKEKWPDLETNVVPLEENFRSTPRILRVASRIIARNTQRIPKTLRPAAMMADQARLIYRQQDRRIGACQADSPETALGAAVHTIQKWLQEGVRPNEIAVLSRVNPVGNYSKALLDRLASACRLRGIPVDRPGSGSLPANLERCIRALAVEAPETDLRDVLNRLAEAGPRWFRGIPLDDLASALEAAFGRGITTFGEWMADLDAAAYERYGGMQGEGLPSESGVVLKTIHQSKGEEYRRVIVLYLANGFFPPSTRRADIEEERRLLYVALTRAEEELVVIGQEGNIFFNELLAAGGEDLEHFVWTEPVDVRASESEADERAFQGGGEAEDARGAPEVEVETASIRQAVGQMSAGQEAYVPISGTGMLEMFNRMFGGNVSDGNTHEPKEK